MQISEVVYFDQISRIFFHNKQKLSKNLSFNSITILNNHGSDANRH